MMKTSGVLIIMSLIVLVFEAVFVMFMIESILGASERFARCETACFMEAGYGALLLGLYSVLLSTSTNGRFHAEVPVGSGSLIMILSMDNAHSLLNIATNRPLVEIVLAIDLGQSYWISCVPRTRMRSE